MRRAKHHLTWPYFGTLSNQQQKLTNMSSTYLQWCIFFSKYFSTVNFWVESGAWSANLKEIHSLLSTNVALDGIAPLHVETGDQGIASVGTVLDSWFKILTNIVYQHVASLAAPSMKGYQESCLYYLVLWTMATMDPEPSFCRQYMNRHNIFTWHHSKFNFTYLQLIPGNYNFLQLPIISSTCSNSWPTKNGLWHQFFASQTPGESQPSRSNRPTLKITWESKVHRLHLRAFPNLPVLLELLGLVYPQESHPQKTQVIGCTRKLVNGS